MSNQYENIYIGTAGWSYKDWNDRVYPKNKAGRASDLAYYAEYFDLVEINSSFYKIPTQDSVRTWLSQIDKNKRFKFNVKLHQGFTHQKTTKDVAQFKKAFEPLLTSPHYGALLIQFPWSYKKEQNNIDHLEGLLKEFAAYHCAVEFRHSSWLDHDTLKLLKEHQAIYVNIDQPVIGDSIKPSSNVTAQIGYARLHGRNYDTWFNAQSDSSARYNYLYNQTEIEEWTERIKDMAEGTDVIFVIFNNHFRGQAAINALQAKANLLHEKVKAPPNLIAEYPFAQNFCFADSVQERFLF